MISLRLCAVLAASAWLAACAALSPQPRAPVTPVPFDLIGRIAVSYDGRSFFSNVRWHHLPERDEIWLLTPAGQTLAHIVSDGEGATLTGADRSQYSGADVESLTRQGLGWELPLTYLGWWVRGEAAPGSAAHDVERDGRARLVALSQDGWRVTLTPDALIENNPLPRRIEVASGSHVIRVVIDGWR
jgi:outer membrane lipoprotein LolB